MRCPRSEVGRGGRRLSTAASMVRRSKAVTADFVIARCGITPKDLHAGALLGATIKISTGRVLPVRLIASSMSSRTSGSPWFRPDWYAASGSDPGWPGSAIHRSRSVWSQPPDTFRPISPAVAPDFRMFLGISHGRLFVPILKSAASVRLGRLHRPRQQMGNPSG